jgi:hypothetical protein
MRLMSVEHAGAASGITALSVPPGGGAGRRCAPPAVSCALPARDDHGDYDKRAARDRPGVSRGTNGWRPTSGQEKESNNRCAC